MTNNATQQQFQQVYINNSRSPSPILISQSRNQNRPKFSKQNSIANGLPPQATNQANGSYVNQGYYQQHDMRPNKLQTFNEEEIDDYRRNNLAAQPQRSYQNQNPTNGHAMQQMQQEENLNWF